MFDILFPVILPKIIALLIGCYYFRYLSEPYRIILYLIVAGILFETAGYFIGHYYQVNLWLFNIYMLVEVFMYCYAAKYFLPRSVSKVLPWLVAGDVAVWIYQIVKYSIFQFALVTLITGALIISVIYIIILTLNTMHSSKGLVKNPLFWLCISIVLYYVCDIPYMTIFAEKLNNYMHKNVSMPMVDVNNILNTVSNLIVAFCFLLIGRQKGADAINI